jgi:hypothetical protein
MDDFALQGLNYYSPALKYVEIESCGAVFCPILCVKVIKGVIVEQYLVTSEGNLVKYG